MKNPLYSLADIRKRNGDSFTLEVEQLEVRGGETLCLVGPTGAGKSTLLRLLSLLELPTTGRISFAGDSPASWPLSTRRKIASVAQRPAMLNDTVRHNVEFGLRMRGATDSRPRVERILKLLRIESLADQNALSLSGGQVQLVALARALVIEPEVLLLDEPTANLDPAHVALVEAVVEEQRTRTGTTVVWVTHNLYQAKRLGTQMALLWDGKLIEVADTATFFDQPKEPTTALFVQGKLVY